MVFCLSEDVEALIVLRLIFFLDVTVPAQVGVIETSLLLVFSSGEDDQVRILWAVLASLGVCLEVLVVQLIIIPAVRDVLDAIIQVELLGEPVHLIDKIGHD